LPTRAIRFVHENIFGSQILPYEDSSHCPFPEEAERFNQEAGEFVRSLA
jgi:pimeloyl-ACP methyl ester carboxylesterase